MNRFCLVLVLFGSLAFASTNSLALDSQKTVVKFGFSSADIAGENHEVISSAVGFINNNISSISGPILVDGYADPVGPSEYNQMLSEKRARAAVTYMKENGVQSQNFSVTGHGETTAFGPGRENRRVEISVTLGGTDTVDLSQVQDLDDGSVSVEPTDVAGSQSNRPSSSFDKHRFGFSLAALHTELASESSGGSADEVLSEVRLASDLNYSYYLSPSFSLKAMAGIRWYEYEENTSVFIEEDQTNWAYRFGLGLGYQVLRWWNVEIMGTYDSQLYYFADLSSGIPEIVFDIESGVRADLTNTFRFYNGRVFNFKTALGAGYLFGADEFESGFSYSVRPSVGFLKNKFLNLYALYQVNDFEVGSVDVKHEILELGVSLDF